MGVETFIGQVKLPINEFKGVINFRGIVLFSGLILLLTIVFAGAASAATIPVTPGNDAIKNAISTASDGDTLDLSAGTYNEHDIVINKNLTITGPKTTNHNPPTAVIDAQKLGRVFMINSSFKVTLQYLIIQKGGTQPLSGGGVYNDGILTINNCTLQKNSATHNGGAINNGDNGILTITDSIITQNSALYGGGISNGKNTILLINSNINQNSAESGGGITSGGDVNMFGSDLNSNIASYSGGGLYIGFADLIMANCNIYNNMGPNGGGISSTWSTLMINDSNIYKNNATDGGGIYGEFEYNIIILNRTNIFQNIATIYGGGIYNDYEIRSFQSNIFQNIAPYGGGICNYVYVYPDEFDSYGKATLTNSNVYNNIGSGIYNNGKGCEVTLVHSNVFNNTAINGGGINNFNGKITLLNSNVYSNTARTGSGGGIYTKNPATVTLTNSNVYNNIALHGNGGGIDNEYRSSLTLTNSNVYSNRAPLGIGGGIYNSNIAKIIMTNSNLSRNKAKYGGGLGNSIYGNASLSFCRIVGNNAQYGSDIYNSMAKNKGTVTAKLNWWGSNNNPISKVQGTLNIIPWLILTLTANPSHIENGASSTLTASLIRDSNGVFHNPAMGHVPDGIQVYFKTTLGTLNSPISSDYGLATTILNSGGIRGVADVSATVDGQILHKSVDMNLPPKVIQIDPAKNALNVSPYKVVKITFNKPIKAGNMWIELKKSNGTPISITSSISANILTVKPSSSMTNSRYNLILHTGSVTDTGGNPIASYSFIFTVNKTSPTVKSISPVKNAINVPINKLIRVTFTEPIRNGNGWIELKNNGGKSIPITFSIINNVLTINHISLLDKATKYTLILHTGSLNDLIGNPVTTYSSYFATAS
jgi:hypothetical protein